MDNSGDLKQQIAQRIKEASNVLVTVSSNPTVDQLAAAIGLTLLLNKLGKHGTAVFSGQVPSTIEFLEPEKTFEKNTDSLRDFIIALDKSKADKLRYKVEDKLVKIFITPYKTSLTEKDLEFSQGDFNVDVVIALGVKKREQLDEAIKSHGRILHDATVISINTDNSVDLGTMNLVDESASSLSEIVVAIINLMQSNNLLDNQMATALLTGIVAETDRFRNAKTSPSTMSISSQLMTAGANQQLIASKLEESHGTTGANNVSSGSSGSADGALQIDHPSASGAAGKSGSTTEAAKTSPGPSLTSSSKTTTSPPAPSVTPLSTSSLPTLEESINTVSLPPVDGSLLAHDEPKNPVAQYPPLASLPPSPITPSIVTTEDDDKTLTDLEKSVHSPHLQQPSPLSTLGLPTEPADKPPEHDEDTHIDAARSAVDQAIAGATNTPQEPEATHTPNLLDVNAPPDSPTSNDVVIPQVTVDDNTGIPKFEMPSTLVSKSVPKDNTASPGEPGSPPPVPPPMMPPSLQPPGNP